MTKSVLPKRNARMEIPTYRKLGVRTFINCTGTYTRLSGSLMPEEVLRAISESQKRYIDMDELMEKAGDWLAAKTGAEWGLVTCGAAAGLAQLTAACVAGGDPEKIVRLPYRPQQDREVIIQSPHRFVYDGAISMVGVKIIEIDTVEALVEKTNSNTVMYVFLGEKAETAAVSLSEMVDIARGKRIPVIVDAAAERPDVPNRYLQEGADAVVYSGGKCLRGPQSSGLVLGRKDLLQAANLHGSPHIGFGRPMKISKEMVMGVLAAVELWLNRDHELEWKMWEDMIAYISAKLYRIPAVKTSTIQPGRANVSPRLLVEWDETVLPVTNREIQARMREGIPSIEIPLMDDGLVVMPYMMEPGEEAIVADSMSKIFETALDNRRSIDEREASPVILTGSWDISLEFVFGEANHKARFSHEDDVIRGRYCGTYFESGIEGTVDADHIHFQTEMKAETRSAIYSFSGTIHGNRMSGDVTFGQYGSGGWKAYRSA